MAKELKCAKCGTKIEPGSSFVEAAHGDIFLEDCFRCEKSGVLLAEGEPYVCLNDAGKPRRFKYERGHYFHPDHAPGKTATATSVAAAAPAGAVKGFSYTAGAAPSGTEKPAVCYLCETPINEECIVLPDGKKIKVECLKKANIDVQGKTSMRLLRTQIEHLKKTGKLMDAAPKEGEAEANQAAADAFKATMAEAKKVGEEEKRKADEAAAAEAERERKAQEEKDRLKAEEAAAEAKAEADKAAAAAAKVTRLEAKGKWTLAELQDAALRREYEVGTLTHGQPETLLSDADFQTAMGMDREAFEKLADFRKTAARKEAKIF